VNSRLLTIVTAVVVVLGLLAFAGYRLLMPAVFTPQLSGYADQPTLGEQNAPVKLILFENFMCDHCKAFEERVFPQLKREYIDTGRVEVYYVNLAWGSEQAVLAGMAGECAYRQDADAFWPFKTALYEAQGQWQTVDDLVAVATAIPGLTPVDLRDCIEEGRYAAEVQRDLELGDQVGVTGTPSVVIGTRGFEAPTLEVLRAAVEEELDN